MDKAILSICDNTSINYLLKTTLSDNYKFISASDVFHAAYELKKKEEIELIIVDLDYHTAQNIDFIHHINSSGFYQMPLIVLSSDDDIESKVSLSEGHSVEFVSKPFSPVNLLEIIDNCLAQSFLLD